MRRLREAVTRSQYRDNADAYRRTFQTPVGERVLVDLADFCCAFRSSVVPGDPMATHVMEGRREVFVRIVALLGLDVADYGKLMGTLVKQPESDDG